jgi:tetratricopeptide (TPR) repeat protein
MAKCYIELKMFDKALNELDKVAEKLPELSLINKMRGELIEKEHRRHKFTETPVELKLPDFEILEEGSRIGSESGGSADRFLDEFEIPSYPEGTTYAKREETQLSYLEELIKKLEAEGLKRRPPAEVEKDDRTVDLEDVRYEDMNIVTPMLAQILASQGAYEEAIKIYKKLIEQRPYEREKFEAEIRKLEKKISDKEK